MKYKKINKQNYEEGQEVQYAAKYILKWENGEPDAFFVEDDQDCKWTRDIDGDGPLSYDTECGEKFWFIDGDLDDNKFQFCSFCGNKIKKANS